MKASFITFLLFIASNLLAQNSWVNFATDYLIWDIKTEGEIVWVATQGGLVKINFETGAKETFQSYNSPLQGTGIENIGIASDGTKWFGTTNGGLIKYDGSNWEQFYYTNTGDTIEGTVELKIAPNDDIWFLPFCTGCRKFMSYANGMFIDHYDAIGPVVNNSRVNDYDFINSNELWVATAFSLVKYDGQNVIELFDASNSILQEEEQIKKIAIDQQGILWVLCQISISQNPNVYRLLKYDGNNWSVETENLPGRCYNSFKDETGKIWVEFIEDGPTTYSYGKYDGVEWTFFAVNDLPNIPYIYSEPELHHVDNEGNLWMSAHVNQFEARIFKVEETSFTEFNTEIFPIGYNYFADVQIDCDSNYWFLGLGSGGLLKFDGLNWNLYSSAETGMSGEVYAMAVDTNTCDLWFAANGNPGGGLVKYNGASFELLSSQSFFDILFENDGTLWAASAWNGLGKYSNSSWTWYNENNSPLSDYNFDIAFDSNGNLWISSYEGKLVKFDGNEWQVFDSSNSPIEDYIISWLYVDNNDNIWVSHDIGLLRYDGTNWEIFDIDTGSLTEGVTCMEQDESGNFWLGTSNGGAIYWNGFDFIYYNVTNSDIGSNYNRNITIDGCGDVWFTHHIGVSLLKQGEVCGESNTNLGAHGIVYYDANQNGVYDFTEDVGLPDHKVFLYPDSIIAFTNSIGAFSFYPDPGDFEVSYSALDPWSNTSNSILDFNLLDDPVTDLNFGAWSNDMPEGVAMDVTVGPIICNQHVNVWVTFRNEGFNEINSDMTLDFDPVFEYVNSFPEVISSGSGQVTWNVEGLEFMESRTFLLILEAPGVDFLNVSFNYIGTLTPGNYSDSDRSELLCGYDPNDKMAQPLGDHLSNYSLQGDSIEYTIRFQNEGNYTAFDIIVVDTLDKSLDINTLRVVSSSHEVQTTLESGRILRFYFEDINLPPNGQDSMGSQGFVKYQISPLSELENNTIIQNSANIYFDFNPPIPTNTTENIIVDSLVISNTENFEIQYDVLIYPNPTSSEVWIEWQNTKTMLDRWEIKIYDLSGKLIQHKSTNKSKFNISLPEQGFYLIQIEKEDILLTKKVVVVQ